MEAPRHFQALDSLRGVCAIIVALFHFRCTGTLANLDFIRNGWIFVDFFFVLSGFIIAHSYATKTMSGEVSVGKFMWLRFGRIYPVHIAVLLIYLAMEFFLTTGLFDAVANRPAFAGNKSVSSFFANIFLLQSFGVDEILTWNGPSWSIAAEMWTYLAFACVFALFKTRARMVFMALGAAALVYLIATPEYLNRTFSGGFIRCIYGFSLGIAAQYIMTKGLQKKANTGGHITETLAVIGVVAFVSMVGDSIWTLVGPIIFAITVLIFTKEAGFFSRILKVRPLVFLGTISYSVYMLHAFVQGRIGDIVEFAGEPFGFTLVKATRFNNEFPAAPIQSSPFAADLLSIVMLILVIIAAWLSYALIEQPFRSYSRKLWNRMYCKTARPADGTGAN